MVRTYSQGLDTVTGVGQHIQMCPDLRSVDLDAHSHLEQHRRYPMAQAFAGSSSGDEITPSQLEIPVPRTIHSRSIRRSVKNPPQSLKDEQ